MLCLTAGTVRAYLSLDTDHFCTFDGLLYVELSSRPPVSFKISQEAAFLLSVQWLSVILQNGSYVLPLLWWGMPMSVSCPVTPDSAPVTPSGFCSYLGITIKITGSWRGIEKYNLKGETFLFSKISF